MTDFSQLTDFLKEQSCLNAESQAEHLTALQTLHNQHNLALDQQKAQHATDLKKVADDAEKAQITMQTTIETMADSVKALKDAIPGAEAATMKMSAPPMPPSIDDKLKIDDGELDSAKKLLDWRSMYAALFRRYKQYANQLGHHYQSVIVQTSFKAFKNSSSGNLARKITDTSERTTFARVIFQGLERNVAALFNTHKVDDDYLVADPICLEYPTSANGDACRDKLALNGLQEFFLAGMTMIENDLFAQVCEITKRSVHSQVIQSFAHRKHGANTSHTPIAAQDRSAWNDDATKASLLRSIPSCGSCVLRWLRVNVRLDPASKYAWLEKQIQLMCSAGDSTGSTIADLDTNEALEKQILDLYTDHLGAYDRAAREADAHVASIVAKVTKDELFEKLMGKLVDLDVLMNKNPMQE